MSTPRIHDSRTCNCETCAAAGEYEAREVVGAAPRAENVSEGDSGSLRANVATVRAAMADVLDAGWQCGKGCDLHHPWAFPTEMFPGDEEPNANDIELRGKFMDAVIERVEVLSQHQENKQ